MDDKDARPVNAKPTRESGVCVVSAFNLPKFFLIYQFSLSFCPTVSTAVIFLLANTTTPSLVFYETTCIGLILMSSEYKPDIYQLSPKEE